MKQENLLEALGISETGAKIYLSLLKSGTSSLSDIARNTAIHRPMVYKAIGELSEKNLLVKTTHGKRILYAPEKPTALLSSLQDLRMTLDEALPEMVQMFEQKKDKPEILFFERKAGIKNAFHAIFEGVENGGIIYRYESPRDYQKTKTYYPPMYRALTGGDNPKTEKWVITNEKTHTVRTRRLWRASKAVPKSFDPFEYNVTQIIYRDKIAFIDYDNETATIIKNARLATFQEKIFRLLFHKLEGLK